MKQKKFKRVLTKTRRRLLGGGQKADRLMLDAANMRLEHDLCPHADEEVVYDSPEAEAADTGRPNAICDEVGCGKKRLRVSILLEGKRPRPQRNATEQAGFELWKDGLLR